MTCQPPSERGLWHTEEHCKPDMRAHTLTRTRLPQRAACTGFMSTAQVVRAAAVLGGSLLPCSAAAVQQDQPYSGHGSSLERLSEGPSGLQAHLVALLWPVLGLSE